MQLLKTWFLALLVLPAAQGCGQSQPAPPIVALPDGVSARPAGLVLDQADILEPASEAALDKHLRDYLDRTGNALIAVSVASLHGEQIDPYATKLFNAWGIGDARTHRGLLILVAPNERKVRIEVGCGLEAAISNTTAGQIIEQAIIPAFRKGDLQAGTLAGVNALEKHLAATSARGPVSNICKKMMRQAA